MAGYTPLFDSLTTGTLCGKWPDIGLWPIVLSLSDWRGQVDVTPAYIARITGLSLEEVVACMKRFCDPDPYSRSTAEGGCRLLLLDPENRDWGWKIVNIQAYRNRASGADQIADGRNAEKVRRYKERHRRTPADTGGHQGTRPDTDSYSYSYSDSDSDTDTSDLRSSVDAVFDHWRKTWSHPGAKLDAKRRKRIEARLKDFSVEQVCQAISGFRNSPWHCGTDPQGNGVVYDGIETLLRDTAQVEKGIALLKRPPKISREERSDRFRTA